MGEPLHRRDLGHPGQAGDLAEWDPEAQRTYDNFNPFERDSVGNACDTNGKFPGETAYKDPIRPDVNFAQMQADRETMAEIMKDPKTQLTGKPGNWKTGWDKTLGQVPRLPLWPSWRHRHIVAPLTRGG